MKGFTSIFLLALLLSLPRASEACSMYKITQNGKTIVGNNEDYFSPNSQFWFEAGGGDTYGAMYMGQLDNFAQGAMNEAGLVFDGFWEPYLELKDSQGKLYIPIGDALRTVMQTMTNVEDVQSYLQTINLNSLANGQLVFVDQSGTYLIVEGDEMITGDESEKTFSNFYYSQTKSINDVELEYFQNGHKFLSTTEEKPTLEYCSEVMKSFSQAELAPTQYSTIYDLNSLKIRVHLLNDFSEYVELDLKKELQKGDHRTMIAELFPKESAGYKHYEKYNNPEHPTLILEEFLSDKEATEEVLLESDFDYIINTLGYEWLNSIQNAEGAIKVFQYGVELMPNNSNLHDSLGEAYFTNSDWNKAITSYAMSLHLNPENENAIAMLSKINDLKKEKAE